MNVYINEKMIDEINEKLLDNGKIIEELAKENQELIKKQIELFAEYITKLNIIFTFIKNKGFYFRHHKSDYISSIGPVIEVDKEENYMYALDFISCVIRKINIYNNEDSKIISYFEFIRDYGVDEAIESLKYNSGLPSIIIDDYKQVIEKRKLSVERNKLK